MAIFDERSESESEFELEQMQICFPCHDLPEIERRLGRYEAGDLVEPAPADCGAR